ncbi:MAG: hypothetical protein A3B90_02205 [Candidatus Magasanikbacteria bacterium RIFCSPHIGHO2_02_FULL_41_13]|uniref:Uncharacterized protein n=1 Tax=Candidatus Magasanikbacteria bacterium RIFCSPHIGHO2_02_FULL_41_13 TaxID=1798676 RepID=A0A1F6M3U1_9BACT|nr:MAG: hypothetical protein A3B90_02205 [Candidatus Magasanikbacteria bacterium RIFCSPHIGHO2_02_FULL_41_13]
MPHTRTQSSTCTQRKVCGEKPNTNPRGITDEHGEHPVPDRGHDERAPRSLRRPPQEERPAQQPRHATQLAPGVAQHPAWVKKMGRGSSDAAPPSIKF